MRLECLLRNGVKLSHLQFRNCPHLTYIGASHLAYALKACDYVQSVDFSGCVLGDAGVAPLIENID